MNTIQTPQKYVPRLHLKSQLRLRPSVKFKMHILAPSDKRLPMHGLMVSETNKYAEQFLALHQLRRSARMRRWTDVTTEMEKFLGIILATGLIQLPKMEDYWKKR